MTVVWTVLAVIAACLVAVFLRSWYSDDGDPDLGAVSQQWIAERRLGQGHDSQR